MTTTTEAGRRQIDHSGHNHEATPAARQQCREQREALNSKIRHNAHTVYSELRNLEDGARSARQVMELGQLPATTVRDAQILGMDTRKLDAAMIRLQAIVEVATIVGLDVDEIGAEYVAGLRGVL